MWVALFKACACDTDELSLFVECGDIYTAAVSHTRTDTADQLEDSICNRSLERHTAFNALRNELLSALLEVSVLR